ncbi:DinB family protein [Deinococcus soli (ex Cha et al. 2016)]|uniref:DinB family protein n=1 Tax=Deinococcus soli (ex Cha et al. 2016) TaxID=1309411 RepID=UPI000699CCD3|nr:DinB family protein [Deinococcus soli (ex Cha et al. 2016)]
MSSTLLSDQPGFTPMIARLLGMMAYTRETTLEAVQGFTVEELDLIPDGHANSAGMLLAHMAAVERIYQLISDDHPDPDGALEAHYWPGLNLGEQGRAEIRGRPLRHYLEELALVRAGTLELLGARDDAWLDEPLPFWGGTGNRHFMWFHVFEDEINHRGQIGILRRHMPGFQGLGLMGAWLEPLQGGRGVRCRTVHPGSPAEEAGLESGDVIVAVDGVDVRDAYFHELRLSAAPGVRSTFTVQRGAETADLTVTRAARPT